MMDDIEKEKSKIKKKIKRPLKKKSLATKTSPKHPSEVTEQKQNDCIENVY